MTADRLIVCEALVYPIRHCLRRVNNNHMETLCYKGVRRDLPFVRMEDVGNEDWENLWCPACAAHWQRLQKQRRG